MTVVVHLVPVARQVVNAIAPIASRRTVEDAQIVVPALAIVAIDVDGRHNRGRLDDCVLTDWEPLERAQDRARPITGPSPEEVSNVLVGGLQIVPDDVAIWWRTGKTSIKR